MSIIKKNIIKPASHVLSIKEFDALRGDGTKNEFTVEVKVTPAVAKHILEKHNPTNRDIRPSAVSALARDMANNLWQGHVGDEVTIDKKGHLNNGQHRLSAIVTSKTTQPMTLRFGIKETAKLVEGNGRSKHYSNYLQMVEGDAGKYKTSRAALTRLVWAFLGDQTTPQSYSKNNKPTNSEMNLIEVELGKSMMASMDYVMNSGAFKIGVATNLAFIHWVISQTSHGN